MTEDIAVYVMTHGPECTHLEDYCIPLEIGAACRDKHLGILRDDTGDNISEKDRMYCELTGLYWMWKNQSHDIVGLYHYRRVFNLSSKRIQKILSNYDIILPKKIDIRPTIDSEHQRQKLPLDWKIMKDVLKELYPDYYESAKLIIMQNTSYAYNMFVTTNRIFNDYCAWLFPILFEVERRFELQHDERLAELKEHRNKPDYLNGYYERAIGFLAERLIDGFVAHNKLRVKEVELELVPPYFPLWKRAPEICKKMVMSNVVVYNVTLKLQEKIYKYIHSCEF